MGNRSYLSVIHADGSTELLADANKILPPFWLSMLAPDAISQRRDESYANHDTETVEAALGLGDGPVKLSTTRSKALSRLADLRFVWQTLLPPQGGRAFDAWVGFVTQFEVADFAFDVTEFTWFFEKTQDALSELQSYLDALEESRLLFASVATDENADSDWLRRQPQRKLKPLLDQCGWLETDWNDPDELYLLLGDAPLHDMPWMESTDSPQ